MTSQRLIDYCKELETLAELVTGQAVHIVAAGELQLTCYPNCAGFYASDLSGIIREKMPGRFKGNLPCVVLNDALYSIAFDVEDRHLCQAIAGHELAHCCELWSPELPVFEPSNHRELLKIVQKEIAIEPRLWQGHSAAPWQGHELRFLRSLAHAKFRLDQQHCTVDAALSFPNSYYGLRRTLGDYSKALESELQDRSCEPIATILETEPPKRFAEMWRDDSRQTRPVVLVASRVE